MTDMKEGIRGLKPQLSQLPYASQVYSTRALEYGTDKYARGNHHGGPPENVTPVERLLAYIDATQRHLGKVATAIHKAIGTGGDIPGACALPDSESSGDFPPSELPHLAHAAASVALAISCAINDGLIPDDPGRPWAPNVKSKGLPQKDDRKVPRL